MNDRAPHRTALAYLHGLGGPHESEAVAGALPRGRNAPQRVPFGLYAEQLSGTSFTAPRAQNLRSWLYRLRPSAMHAAFRRIGDGRWRSAPCSEAESTPNRVRWGAPPAPEAPTDFLDGLATMATAGDARAQHGASVHVYCANRSMDRVMYDADGELLVVPQEGTLDIFTELGRLAVAPGEIALVPRGVRFRVGIDGALARGYVCENHGAPFRLPELGPIGANGLAATRDFEVPVAAFEDREEPLDVVARMGGHLWLARYERSPLDVVAWHGNYHPWKYDLARFNAMNTVTFDHPDPSIFTVVTSPSDTPGTANVDFVVFPPRWSVAENTFRPPYFHRNVMSEFMGLVQGSYDAKQGGFVPGGCSLHNCMSAHGPDAASFEKALNMKLEPVQVKDTLAFMFESRFVMRPTPYALNHRLQSDYLGCWRGLPKNFKSV